MDKPRAARIDTPFVKGPGLLARPASTMATSFSSWRGSEPHALEGRPSGERYHGRCILPQGLTDFGLHIVDLNLTMGNLLAVVGDETRAYLAKAKKD